SLAAGGDGASFSTPSIGSIPSTPRSASTSALSIARSTVGSLPVSGAGAMGGVANAAGEVARTVAEETATQQIARFADAGGGSTSYTSGVTTAAAGSVQRALGGGGGMAAHTSHDGAASDSESAASED